MERRSNETTPSYPMKKCIEVYNYNIVMELSQKILLIFFSIPNQSVLVGWA